MKGPTSLGCRVFCMVLVVFALCQSAYSHACTVKAVKKIDGKETRVFTLKNGVLPTSVRLEVDGQELPLIEEFRFCLESDEQPVEDFTFLVRRFYVDLFRVITPSNAP